MSSSPSGSNTKLNPQRGRSLDTRRLFESGRLLDHLRCAKKFDLRMLEYRRTTLKYDHCRAKKIWSCRILILGTRVNQTQRESLVDEGSTKKNGK